MTGKPSRRVTLALICVTGLASAGCGEDDCPTPGPVSTAGAVRARALGGRSGRLILSCRRRRDQASTS
jgi:hypothetical protein